MTTIEQLINNDFRDWYKQPSATEQGIEDAEAALHIRLPGDYKSFLLWSNGGEGQVGNTYLSLWEVESLLQLNKDYKIDVYLPNVLCVGTDGGSTAFCLDYFTSPDAPAFAQVPLGDLSRETLTSLGSNFTAGLLFSSEQG